LTLLTLLIAVALVLPWIHFALLALLVIRLLLLIAVRILLILLAALRVALALLLVLLILLFLLALVLTLTLLVICHDELTPEIQTGSSAISFQCDGRRPDVGARQTTV
jgi:hypothetical protein